MKENIGVFMMTLLLMFILMFGFKTCAKDSGNNFAELNYSLAGNTVSYPTQSRYEKKEISVETPLVRYTFTTDGAALSAYEIINKNKPNSAGRQLILNTDNEKLPFRLYWGNDRRHPDHSVYQYQPVETDANSDKSIHRFTATLLDNDRLPVEVVKTFTFSKKSFMWTLDVEFKTAENRIPNLGADGYSYSVYYGPQLGPKYTELSKSNSQYGDHRTIYKNFIEKGKIKTKILQRSEIIQRTATAGDIHYYAENADPLNWVALTGKYFVFIAEIPRQTKHLFYESDSISEKNYENEFFLTQAKWTDTKNLKSTYYFYLGPKNPGYLKTAEKAFGRDDLKFSHLASKGFLGLNVLVEKIIGFINYKMHINNWGWSIILFTVFIKLLLFGLTRKSYESTSKMQTLAPKLAELKEKYKDDPQLLQTKTMELYQKEKINPMGGCLPLLIQMPILIAIFAFINNSYEMSGQPFIWWIKDLSVPDAVVAFKKPIPLLAMKSLNLLPVIYVLTQFLSTLTLKPAKAKTPSDKKEKGKKEKKKVDAQSVQNGLMQYGMPVLFFFILYNAPAGLFVYWITMNLITVLQQLFFKYCYPQISEKINIHKHNRSQGNGKNSGSTSFKIKKGPSQKGSKIKNA